jgi:endonuclease YncB( thermonuclease family)
MDHPRYRAVRGTFVAAGYAPDGDTIRFAPDRLADLDTLLGTQRLRIAKDTTVSVRLEGIDAPELHYAAREQRCASTARDALLRALAFGAMHIEEDFVVRGDFVRGSVLTRSVDPNGRVIAYAFREGAESIASSVNAAMLREGMAYPLAYDTQPPEHRALFAELARAARRARVGVWQHDKTAAFALATEASIGVRGALIFPKLFRRCVSYLGDRFHGFRGSLREWLEKEAGPGNDVMIVGGKLMRLSALVASAQRSVTTRIDATRAVFVAR